MNDILRRIAWRTKWGWRVCAGHFIDSDGCYSRSECEHYRFVYAHLKTGEVRYEDRKLNPWYAVIGLPLLEAFAVLVVFWAIWLAWLVLP